MGATIMSWMVYRSTSRPEDMAYALLGLFNVTMPLLYGEGGYNAFIRLQEVCLKGNEDHSLFLWSPRERQEGTRGLLSDSPARFSGFAALKFMSNPDPEYRDYSDLSPVQNHSIGYRRLIDQGKCSIGDPISMTSLGLRINLWLLDISQFHSFTRVHVAATHIALLNVLLNGSVIGIFLTASDLVDNMFKQFDGAVCMMDAHSFKQYADKMRYQQIYIEQQPRVWTILPPPPGPNFDYNRASISIEIDPNGFIVDWDRSGRGAGVLWFHEGPPDTQSPESIDGPILLKTPIGDEALCLYLKPARSAEEESGSTYGLILGLYFTLRVTAQGLTVVGGLRAEAYTTGELKDAIDLMRKKELREGHMLTMPGIGRLDVRIRRLGRLVDKKIRGNHNPEAETWSFRLSIFELDSSLEN